MSSVACIILAAGEGTRMRSARPKVLHELCGQPLLHYVRDVALAVRCRPVVTVIGAGAADVRAQLPTGWRMAHQTVRRGTGHAVALALKHLPKSISRVLILYGDQPLVTIETVRALIAKHAHSQATCTILTAKVADPRAYGRVVRRGEHVASIVEDLDATDEERAICEINVGVAVCQRHLLDEALRHITPANAKREYYLTDAITWLASHPSHGEVHAYQTPDADEALGINSRRDLAVAARVLQQRAAERLMDAGVTVVDPHTTYISPDARVGEDTTIYPCTVIERHVVIGRRCNIGPFARLRRGAHIGDDVRVGNFAEVVRSTLGARTKMNHCSYLGDTTVGTDVNIGAGTITANFDGRKKHRTQIGSNAFIGSGTVVVSPAVVGPRATTGAGAVVTRKTRIRPGAVFVGVPARELASKRRKEHA